MTRNPSGGVTWLLSAYSIEDYLKLHPVDKGGAMRSIFTAVSVGACLCEVKRVEKMSPWMLKNQVDPFLVEAQIPAIFLVERCVNIAGVLLEQLGVIGR